LVATRATAAATARPAIGHAAVSTEPVVAMTAPALRRRQ